MNLLRNPFLSLYERKKVKKKLKIVVCVWGLTKGIAKVWTRYR
jgi:hypothetical protein